MAEEFYVKEFPNGLTLLGQRMDNVSSASMTMLVPCGASHDPSGLQGSAAVAAEWFLRGAGDRNSRQINDALDALGCQHHESVQGVHTHFSASQLSRNLNDILDIYADILLRPRLEDETFEPCRDLTLQDLASLEDQPARKCNMLLQEKFYPAPLGQCVYGTEQSLQALSPRAVRSHVQNHFCPKGSIFSVAGDINWPQLCKAVEKHFGQWSHPTPEETAPQTPVNGVTHIQKDSAPAHIALAHKSMPISHEQYYPARMAVAVLSGGMSSRLFTEVREKRGLVYHVSTRHHSLKDHAGMFTYAGTVPEKAQETFDVTVGELRRLVEGIEKDELDRSKTQLKSSLVMQGESTGARANAMVGDWYHLGRLQSLEEMSRKIDDIQTDQVLDYLRTFPADDFTILVIGPENIKTN